MIRFAIDGSIVALEVGATETVLDLLRYRLRRVGTKEGCAEGDCGACTILLGERDGEDVVWRAVNACILFAPMLDGKAIKTVESLARDGELAPIQSAMIECHASQCGFCTPGFVMSLHGRSIGALGTKGRTVADVLSGNLCRCTGYGPILRAAKTVESCTGDDGATSSLLKTLANSTSGPGWFAPRSTDALADVMAAHPNALIVAGATDVGLWVTKQQRDLGTVVFVGDIADLRRIDDTGAGLTIGAAVRYSDAWDALAGLHPKLGELVRRIAGTQVRNAGTIGGNIANGSPIGDMPPALIALGATLTLRNGVERRTMLLEDFFVAYGRQHCAPGEFLESVFIPRLNPALKFDVAKISKRFDSDISAVCGAFAVMVVDGRVANARVAFGGLAATPKRATACEAALIGEIWNEATVDAASNALLRDFQPISDVRGSASYRLTVAGNLLRRLWLSDAHPAEALSVLSGSLSDG